MMPDQTSEKAEVKMYRGGGVINFQRAADPKAARFRPAPRIHVGVFDLVLGIDAALALAFEAQLERNPSHPHIETLPERHARIERQVGVRTLEVRVHLHFCFLARLLRHRDLLSNDPSAANHIRQRSRPDAAETRGPRHRPRRSTAPMLMATDRVD